jgi:hypothetical protein
MATTATTAYTQIGETKPVFPLAVYNNSATAIPVNTLVIPDASNIMDNDDASPCIAVTAPTGTSTPSRCIGITTTEIPPYDSGTIEGFGPVRQGVCKGAITSGASVANSIASTFTGNIATAVASYPSVGIALCTGADTDIIPFMVAYSATSI